MIHSKKMLTLTLGVLLLITFAGFSKYVKNGGLKDADFAVTVKLQEKIDKSTRLRAARLVGEVMEGSTFLASPAVSVAGIIVITLITFIKKKKNRITAMVIPLAFLFLILAEIYGKSVVHHPAPPFFLLKNPTTVFPTYHVWEEYSYPSGHAVRAVFLAISSFSLLTTHFLRKRGRLGMIGGLVVYVSLVSASRIYLGHHWLSDVAGGSLLGGVIGFLIFVIPGRRGLDRA